MMLCFRSQFYLLICLDTSCWSDVSIWLLLVAAWLIGSKFSLIWTKLKEVINYSITRSYDFGAIHWLSDDQFISLLDLTQIQMISLSAICVRWTKRIRIGDVYTFLFLIYLDKDVDLSSTDTFQQNGWIRIVVTMFHVWIFNSDNMSQTNKTKTIDREILKNSMKTNYIFQYLLSLLFLDNM